jgi:hypothetical protein
MVERKEFFIVELNHYEGLDNITVRELRDSIIKGLERGLRYISIINPDGVNRAEEAGHTCENIEINEYLIVLNDDDEIDIEKTADLVTKDFIINGMIICMRDRFEEIKDTNGKWIDKILNKGDDDA